jgi:hypothetical protein
VRSVSVGRYIIVVVAAAFTLSVSGCGSSGGSSSSDPSDVVNQYIDALAAGDGAKGCSLLTSEGQAKWETYSQANSATPGCEEGIKDWADLFKLDPAKVSVGQSQINGNSATVDVSVGAKSDTYALEKIGDTWQISKPGD